MIMECNSLPIFLTSQHRFGKKFSLTLSTASSALISLLFISIAVSKDSWLFTYRRDYDTNRKGTILTVFHSGLWHFCNDSVFFQEVNEKTPWERSWLSKELVNETCSSIKYFTPSGEPIRPEKPQDNVIYEMKPMASFPVFGLIFLLIGCLLSIFSFYRNEFRRCIFFSGCIFVISGIFMLIGLVLCVGSVSQSFDSSASTFHTDSIHFYTYGSSFYLTVFAFFMSEFAGTSAVYLFLAQLSHFNRIKAAQIQKNDNELTNSNYNELYQDKRMTFKAQYFRFKMNKCLKFFNCSKKHSPIHDSEKNESQSRNSSSSPSANFHHNSLDCVGYNDSFSNETFNPNESDSAYEKRTKPIHENGNYVCNGIVEKQNEIASFYSSDDFDNQVFVKPNKDSNYSETASSFDELMLNKQMIFKKSYVFNSDKDEQILGTNI